MPGQPPPIDEDRDEPARLARRAPPIAQPRSSGGEERPQSHLGRVDDDPTVLHSPPGSGRGSWAPGPPPSQDGTVLQPPPGSGRGSWAPGPPPSQDGTVLQPAPGSGRGSWAPGPPPSADRTVLQPPPSNDRTAIEPPPSNDRTALEPPPSSDWTVLQPPPGKAQQAAPLQPTGVAPSMGTSAPGGEDLEAPPGSTIGGYEVVRTLGKGGMGIVYLARDPRLERKVALKVLPITAGTQESAVARFQREAKAIATLDHPNIRPIYGWGRDDAARVFWLAMGFVDGRPYDDVVREVGLGHESARRAAKVVADAARALAYAHERGVIHRDIKPSNLMLEGAKVHVVDFGLARLEGSAELTVEGQVMGTLKFMPPEQALGAEASALSDVYSLGATLFWALTGEGPYDAQRIENLQLKVAKGDPTRRPSELRPDVPRDLEAIVCKALEVEPTDRYGGAAALADDLERFLADEPVLARAPGRWREVQRALRRHAWVAVPAVLVLVGLVVLRQVLVAPRRAADAAIAALIAPDWTKLDAKALLERRAALRQADPAKRASDEGRQRLDAALRAIDAGLADELARAQHALDDGVRAWARPAGDARPPRVAPTVLAAHAARAHELGRAISAEESLGELLASAATALVQRAEAVLALARAEGGALRLTAPPGLVLVTEEGERPLPSGQVELPAWGALLTAERAGHVRAARLYDPLDLLAGLPAPAVLKGTRWAGMVRVEAPGVTPFLLDVAEVSQAQFAAFVKDGYAQDACWTAEGRAWRDRQEGRRALLERTVPAEGALPVTSVSVHEARAYAAWTKRRLPTPAEWLVAAGLEPWRAPPSGGGLGELKPAAEAWDVSPVGAKNMAGNVAEWLEDGTARGGDCREVGLDLGPRALPRGADVHRAVGFRCAATPPDVHGGAP